MFVKIRSVAFIGMNPVALEVEVNVTNKGLPGFDIVGLPSKSIEESRQRVKAALQNSGEDFPNKKITVNLAPADLYKEGACYDLPIAVGIFCAANNIIPPNDGVYYGELSMNGTLRYTKRLFLVLTFALETHCSVNAPLDNLTDARFFQNSNCYWFSTLKNLLDYTKTKKYLQVSARTDGSYIKEVSGVSDASLYDSIIGNNSAKRVLEIAVAGRHALLIVGPPGTGKTMLAKSAVSLMPPLNDTQKLENAKINSYVGKSSYGDVPPFRSPHHTTSLAGMIGGGPNIMPGEVTLANNGILFLDEFCEFNRNVLESLRQPLQEGRISLVRSKGVIEYPSKFLLIAATNPCPCGYFGDADKQCVCSPLKASNYRAKISGPLADRVDLHINVAREKVGVVSSGVGANCNYSAFTDAKNRINACVVIQQERYKAYGIFFNSQLNSEMIKKACVMDNNAKKLLDTAYDKMHLSLRQYFKTVSIAQTISDLVGAPKISLEHLAEALQYRGVG